MEEIRKQQEEINSISGGNIIAGEGNRVICKKCGGWANGKSHHSEGSGCNKKYYYKYTCEQCGYEWIDLSPVSR